MKEILNIFKYRWNNYKTTGNLDGNYWKEAKEKAYIKKSRKVTSLKTCFTDKRKYFNFKKFKKAIKFVKTFKKEFFINNKGIYTYYKNKEKTKKFYPENIKKL